MASIFSTEPTSQSRTFVTISDVTDSHPLSSFFYHVKYTLTSIIFICKLLLYSSSISGCISASIACALHGHKYTFPMTPFPGVTVQSLFTEGTQIPAFGDEDVGDECIRFKMGRQVEHHLNNWCVPKKLPVNQIFFRIKSHFPTDF